MDETEPKVRCYAGYMGQERPVAVEWEGERREVEEILERRREPEGAVFKVRLAGGRRLLLRYLVDEDRWTAVEFS